MKELSIFIDESGDFGCYSPNCPYYIISLVLHEQENNIDTCVQDLDRKLLDLNLKNHTIHTAPLIRREKSYKDFDISKRLKIFNMLSRFTTCVGISYETIVIDKKQTSSILEINRKISKSLASFLRDNISYFSKFDNIIIYYDNGQMQLTNILVSVFNTIFDEQNVDFRGVVPLEYKLFQSADFICTIELINQRLLSGKDLTKSEYRFFKSRSSFKKNYLKKVEKLKFK